MEKILKLFKENGIKNIDNKMFLHKLEKCLYDYIFKRNKRSYDLLFFYVK